MIEQNGPGNLRDAVSDSDSTMKSKMKNPQVTAIANLSERGYAPIGGDDCYPSELGKSWVKPDGSRMMAKPTLRGRVVVIVTKSGDVIEQ